MTLKTATEIKTLNYVMNGCPFVQLVVGDNSGNLNYIINGTPYYATPIVAAPVGNTYVYSSSTSSTNVTSFVRQANKKTTASEPSFASIIKDSSLEYSVNRSTVAALLKSSSITVTPGVVSAIANAIISLGAVTLRMTAAALSLSNSAIQKTMEVFHLGNPSSTANQSKAALLNRNVLSTSLSSSITNFIIGTYYVVCSALSNSFIGIGKEIDTIRNTSATSIANSVKQFITDKIATITNLSFITKVSDKIANAISYSTASTSDLYELVIELTVSSYASMSKQINSAMSVLSGTAASVKKAVTSTYSAISNVVSSITKIPSVLAQALSISNAFKSETFEMVIELLVASNATISRQISSVISTIANTTTSINKLIKSAFAGNLFSRAELVKDVSQTKLANVESIGSVGKMVDLVKDTSSAAIASIQKQIEAILSAIVINTSSSLIELKQLISTLISFFVTINNNDIVNEEVIVTTKQTTFDLAGVDQVTFNLEGTERVVINL